MARDDSNEAQEHTKGTKKARDARKNVAKQLAVLIEQREITGDRDLLAMRLRQVFEAEEEGDRDALRASVMEVTLAAAGWVVAIDLRQRTP